MNGNISLVDGRLVCGALILRHVFQYGFVFGIVHLVAGVTAPIFAHFGNQWGPKLLYNAGAFLQGFAGISFGLLEYVDGTAAFLGLSYFLRLP